MKQKGSLAVWLIVTIIILLVGAFSFFWLGVLKNPFIKNDSTGSFDGKVKIEVAKRSYFKNGIVASTIEERSRRYDNGSLETVVLQAGKKLNHIVYLKDKISNLSNGILTEQKFKNEKTSADYKTSSENFIEVIKKTKINPTSSTVNGKKVKVYNLNSKKQSFFQLVKLVQAQQLDVEGSIQLYVDEATGQLLKVEQTNDSNEIVERIDYSFEDSDVQLSQATQSANSELLPPIEQLAQEATETNVIEIDPPIVPDEAIFILPMTVFITPSGYNSPLLELTSLLFNKEELIEKTLQRGEAFDNQKFIAENVKVRFDGNEVNSESIGDIGTTDGSSSQSVLSSFVVTIPKGLVPGTHSIEVFWRGSWYLSPNLMISAPLDNEPIVEIPEKFDTPPLATLTADGSAYTIILPGKNFSKPITVALQGNKLDDKYIEVRSSEALILTFPKEMVDINHGPYDLTIIKGNQEIHLPSFLTFTN